MMRPSSKASRSPTLNPCPATGCSVCAALPSATARPAAGLRAYSSASGNERRSATRVKFPARVPKCTRSAARNSASPCSRSVARALGRRRPHQRVVVGLGQQRHRPLRGEPLEGAAPVRRRAPDLGDQRDLAIVVALSDEPLDAGAGAVGDHRQPCAHDVDAVAAGDQGLRGGRGDAGHADAVPHAHAGAGQRGILRLLQRAVADHVAQRGQPRVGSRRASCCRSRPPARRRWRRSASPRRAAARRPPRRRGARGSGARRATARASDRRAASRPAPARRARRRRGRCRRAPAPASRRPDRRRRWRRRAAAAGTQCCSPQSSLGLSTSADDSCRRASRDGRLPRPRPRCAASPPSGSRCPRR